MNDEAEFRAEIRPLTPYADWAGRLHYERVTRLESLMRKFHGRLRDNVILCTLYHRWMAGSCTFEEMLLTAVLELDDSITLHGELLRRSLERPADPLDGLITG